MSTHREGETMSDDKTLTRKHFLDAIIECRVNKTSSSTHWASLLANHDAAQRAQIEEDKAQELARDASRDGRIEDTDASVIRLCRHINRLRAERDALRADNDALREALENLCTGTRGNLGESVDVVALFAEARAVLTRVGSRTTKTPTLNPDD